MFNAHDHYNHKPKPTFITHYLKCHPAPFIGLWNRTKTFELRKNDDRIFEPGDDLYLIEMAREKDPTGRIVKARILDIYTARLGGYYGMYLRAGTVLLCIEIMETTIISRERALLHV